jgi:hypothetical protein
MSGSSPILMARAAQYKPLIIHAHLNLAVERYIARCREYAVPLRAYSRKREPLCTGLILCADYAIMLGV